MADSKCMFRRPGIRPLDRQRMKPWLIHYLDSENVYGLKWEDRAGGIFSIKWQHASSTKWNLSTDADVFERWARHTGKHKEGDISDPKRWKANFRCALNSLSDVKFLSMVKHGGYRYRIYQILKDNTVVKAKTGRKDKQVGTNSFRVEFNISPTQERQEAITLHQCVVCDEIFEQKEDLEKHNKIHVKEDKIDDDIKTSYRCGKCSENFEKYIDLEKHSKIHVKMEKLDDSDMEVDSDCQEPVHFDKGDVQLDHICIVCGKKFNTTREMEIHNKVHVKIEKYDDDKINDIETFHECNLCEKVFKSDDELSKHCKIHVKNEKTRENPLHENIVSDSNFDSIIEQRKGSEIIGSTTYKCDVCDESYGKVSDLEDHLRIHTAVNPYKCEFCGKLFNNRSHMCKQVKIYTHEKPYNCDVCSKSFNRTKDLEDHKRIHTGEKPFPCDVCGKSFKQVSHLRIHMRIHTGEKTYKCNGSNSSFCDKSNLAQHVQVVHGEKKYKCEGRKMDVQDESSRLGEKQDVGEEMSTSAALGTSLSLTGGKMDVQDESSRLGEKQDVGEEMSTPAATDISLTGGKMDVQDESSRLGEKQDVGEEMSTSAASDTSLTGGKMDVQDESFRLGKKPDVEEEMSTSAALGTSLSLTGGNIDVVGEMSTSVCSDIPQSHTRREPVVLTEISTRTPLVDSKSLSRLVDTKLLSGGNPEVLTETSTLSTNPQLLLEGKQYVKNFRSTPGSQGTLRFLLGGKSNVRRDVSTLPSQAISPSLLAGKHDVRRDAATLVSEGTPNFFCDGKHAVVEDASTTASQGTSQTLLCGKDAVRDDISTSASQCTSKSLTAIINKLLNTSNTDIHLSFGCKICGTKFQTCGELQMHFKMHVNN